MDPLARLKTRVVNGGICTGCGACVAVTGGAARMVDTPFGPVPEFPADAVVPELAWEVCPGKGVAYAELHRGHYGKLPDSWLTGSALSVYTGHAAAPEIRAASSSGGVTTAVLLHLLATGQIDAAILVRQGVPSPEQARVVLATTPEEVHACAQSVYIPVSTLDILARLEPGKCYAMTCLPDAAAALRQLQLAGFAPAQQVHYVLGPYTGTAMYPAAIRSFLRSWGVAADDAITSLKWRAGDWPGYLEIVTASGRVIRSNKFYYNYLIPFFITQNSLQGMDFANEFCDLSVGDAWSPAFESQGGGHSVVAVRSAAMEAIVTTMREAGELALDPAEPLKASEMHGHMIDFKKRGSYLRNRWRRRFGFAAPDHRLRPRSVPLSRAAVEVVISSIFLMAGTAPARWCVERVPERWIGPFFNRLRLTWKALSKPTKRKGLGGLAMDETTAD